MANLLKFINTEEGKERVIWLNKDAILRVDPHPFSDRTLIRMLDGVQDCVDEPPEIVVAKFSDETRKRLIKFVTVNGKEWLVNPTTIVDVFKYFGSGETTIRLNCTDEAGDPVYIKVVDTLDEVLAKVNGVVNA